MGKTDKRRGIFCAQRQLFKYALNEKKHTERAAARRKVKKKVKWIKRATWNKRLDVVH